MRLADIQPDLILAVPRSPGAQPAQLGSQPQPEADRAARVPEVRRPARRDLAARRRAGAGRADEALRAADAGLPDADRRWTPCWGSRAPSWSSQRDHLLLCHALQHRRARLRDRRGARGRRRAGPAARACTCMARGASCDRYRCGTSTVAGVRAWLRLNPTLRGEAALLPNRDGQAMSRSNVAQRLDLAVKRAAAEQPSLLKKRVSPHTLRHTTAMHLLQSRRAVQRDRPVARPREHDDDASLRRGRPRDEGEGARPTAGARHQDAVATSRRTHSCGSCRAL